MATRIVKGVEELRQLVGEDIGTSEWVEITQERVNKFAEATGDHQWIHTDPERAKKESPFGGPIAHGFLTISLSPLLQAEVMIVDGITMGVNYGLNKLRFPAPVPVGCRVRMHMQLKEVTDVTEGVVQVTSILTFEVEGQEKPACVAESIARFYF